MKKDQGFFQCYNSVFRENNLTVYEKVVFCILLSLSKGGTQEVFVSYETVAKFAGIGRTKAYNCIKQLIVKKYIKYSEKQKRNSKSYRIVNRWAVHDTNISCSPHEPQKFTTRTGEVHEMNSINSTSLNITNINKQKKVSAAEDELIDKIILLWNLTTGQKLHVTTKQYRDDIRWGIKQFNGLSADDKLAKFRYAFENKKRMADDDKHPFTTMELPTIMRKGKFMGNVDAQRYGGNATDHRTPAERVQAMSDDKARLAREQAR